MAVRNDHGSKQVSGALALGHDRKSHAVATRRMWLDITCGNQSIAFFEKEKILLVLQQLKHN
jgi:hypothetical protein